MAEKHKYIYGCDRDREFCTECGSLLLTSFMTAGYESDTGLPVIKMYHVCPKRNGIWMRTFGDPWNHAKHEAITDTEDKKCRPPTGKAITW